MLSQMMVLESILFFLAFEASFSAVHGSAYPSDDAAANSHVTCVSHAVAVAAVCLSLSQQLLRTR